jgi:hypothetical protein
MRLLDSLPRSLRGCLDRFPDKRLGINTTYGMGDIGMAAFLGVFHAKPVVPGPLAAIRKRLRPLQLCKPVRHRHPCDNHIRNMLD